MTKEEEEHNLYLTSYRGKAISVTPEGEFTVEGEDVKFSMMQQAKGHADRVIQAEVRAAEKDLAIRVIRADGVRGTVTGINRNNRAPKMLGMPPAGQRTPELYFDHPWVEETLKERDEAARRLDELNRQAGTARARISGNGRIEPEDYQAAIEELQQKERDSREKPAT